MFKRIGKPIVDSCIQGYNSTIFAYGQTGSGKTHTIQGQGAPTPGQPHADQRGLLPRQFEYLFQEVAKITAKHRFLKDRRNQGKTISPAGAKGSSAMNF